MRLAFIFSEPHMIRPISLRAAAGTALALAALGLSGCGGEVKLVPAEGVVKVGGRPAANVSVQFMPDVMKGGSGPTSYGETDAEGKFRLKTHDGRDGAVPGPHTVILADLAEERTPQGQAPKPPRLNVKYTTAAGGLAAEVKEGGGPIVLEVPAN